MMKEFRRRACEALLLIAVDKQADRVDRRMAAQAILEFTEDHEPDKKASAVGFEAPTEPVEQGCDTGGHEAGTL